MTAHARRQPQASRTTTTTLSKIAEHALDAVVTMDRGGVITGWNRHAEELFGWTASEAIGRLMAKTIIPMRYRSAHAAGLARYLLTGVGHVLDRPIDIAALHRDGHEFPVELSITSVTDAGGPSFIGFVRDLTERRAMEMALRDSEARFQSLVESLPGVAYIDELGGAGRYVSPKLEEMLGYAPDEWLANPDLWEQLLHPDDRERALAQLAAGEVSGEPFTIVYRLIARDGRTVWIRDQATVRRDESGELTVHGVMFDISRERGAEADLEFEIAERAAISESLHRLPTGAHAEQTAQAICGELLRIAHLDTAAVFEYAHDGPVIPLGLVAPPGVPDAVDRPLPTDRADYLRRSSSGPWIDEWHRGPQDDPCRLAWLDAGLTCAAYVPFGADGEIYGLLSAGTTAPIGSAGVARWLPALTEFAAIAAALLVPELGERRAQAGTRAAIEEIIAARAFTTIYQPIVRLSDASVIGFEALTAFADGTPPDRRFAVADSVGAGAELEAAAVGSAMTGAGALPAGPWVSVNLSPSRLTDPGLPRLLVTPGGRSIVIEITERSAIEDYALARAALETMAGRVEVAVDDAGAGFASLRHIIELRPRYVKLDMQLVRGVEADAARQALIAGMVYFARQSGCLLVAEGIETVAERETLRRIGVPFGQGFLFGHPAPAGHWASGIVRAERPRLRRTARRADA
jgi:PAS domain S-box-containing protein